MQELSQKLAPKKIPIQTLLIEYDGTLPIHSAELGEVAIIGSGVGTADGLLIAVEGHGSLVHISVAAAKKVVSQHLVVGSAVAVEVVGEGLCLVAFRDGEHGVGSVQRVQRIKPLTHLAVLTATEQEASVSYTIYKV